MDNFAKRLPQVILAVFVILAATAVSGFFGFWAGALSGMDREGHTKVIHIRVGADVGATAGFLAAILWLLAMRRVMRESGAARVILLGGGLGTAAGFLASLILHAALFFSGCGHRVGGHLVDAAIFGLPAGLVTGLVCGLAAWGTAKWSRRHE